MKGVSSGKYLRGMELEEVEEASSVKDSDVGSIDLVSGDVDDSVIGFLGSVNGIITRSDIGRVDEIVSRKNGVINSEIDSVGDLLSDSNGIEDAEVGHVENVAASRSGIYDSEVGDVGRIFAKDGIRDSQVDSVGRIVARDIDMRSKGIVDSQVGNVGSIEASIGISGESEVGSVERIDAVQSGISGYVEVGEVGTIESESHGVEGSVSIDYIDHISAEELGVRKGSEQDIKEIGSMDAGGDAIGYRTNVGSVSGDVSAGEHLINSASNPVKFFGDIEVQGHLFSDTKGNLIANESTEASGLDGALLGESGNRNLVITKDLELDERLKHRSAVITPPDQEGTIDYHGDFSELFQAAEDEGLDFLDGLRRFGSPQDEFDTLEDLMEENDRQLDLYDKALRNLGIGDEVAERFGVFASSFPVESLYQARISERMTRDLGENAWPKMLKLSQFGTALSQMDGEYRMDFFDRLKTDKDRDVLEGEVNSHTGEEVWFDESESSLADKLFSKGLEREFYVFVDDEASQIEDMLDVEGELPNVEGILDEINIPDIDESYEPDLSDSPYAEVLTEMVDRYEEDIRLLSGLSDIVDVEGNPFDSLKPVKDIKNKEAKRHAQIQSSGLSEEEVNQRLDEGAEDYSEWFREHIDSMIRDYVGDAILEIGKEEAEELYPELADEEKPVDEISDGELAAMMVYARSDEMAELEKDEDIGWEKVKGTVQDLFDHRDSIYTLGENGEWLDTHGYDSGELVDPEVSVQDSDLFESVESSRLSAVRAYIDSEDIKVNTDERQEEYLSQVKQFAQELGLEPPEEDVDIERMERSLKNLETEKQQTVEYREAMEAINNYRGAGNLDGGVPDEMVFRVATPMETSLMGKGLQSCHDPEVGSQGWAAVSHAVKPNTLVMTAGETEDDIQARVKAYITEDEQLVYHHTSHYQNVEADLSEHFEEYMTRVSEELGLGGPVDAENYEGWKDNFELLEAHDQYLDE